MPLSWRQGRRRWAKRRDGGSALIRGSVVCQQLAGLITCEIPGTLEVPSLSSYENKNCPFDRDLNTSTIYGAIRILCLLQSNSTRVGGCVVWEWFLKELVVHQAQYVRKERD